MAHRGARKLVTILVLAIALSAAGAASASGSYRGRPSGPPSSIDRASYELGKKIFAGQFSRNEGSGDHAEQEQLLEELQTKLPRKARTNVDLPSYAGELDAEQLAALQYFLRKRYKVQ